MIKPQPNLNLPPGPGEHYTLDVNAASLALLQARVVDFRDLVCMKRLGVRAGERHS